ncbi:hypothetical protein N7471_007826 [Penicillium samsonianum]|uniref:uncharacterized protein n=1 Tax=Penicillium samsonianum TaxID=1882272 RepID=UPI0025478F74|nr:uncharacterized protein N7471_007826 [Penicillium samsonianum]KAJ6132611.1 hypothetical protein N7471_007826 [Penicillium samsonianum]
MAQGVATDATARRGGRGSRAGIRTYRLLICFNQSMDPSARQSVLSPQAPSFPSINIRDATSQSAPIITSPAEPLFIKFEEMFCRHPVPPEHDFEVSLDELEEISSDVWIEQGL